jgi:hypothetical protein
MDDVESAAEAVQAVVDALDEALCALLVQHPGPASPTAAHRPLVAAIQAGASLEITQILLEGATISVATADLRTTAGTLAPSSWQARLQTRDQRWQLITFNPAPAP